MVVAVKAGDHLGGVGDPAQGGREDVDLLDDVAGQDHVVFVVFDEEDLESGTHLRVLLAGLNRGELNHLEPVVAEVVHHIDEARERDGLGDKAVHAKVVGSEDVLVSL